MERPIPTPPPGWMDTQEAPDAVLTSAFSSGQSAIASDPSAIDSVSRYGEATEPESRWSRPIPIGAFSSPGAPTRWRRGPSRARSPYPSQQIRAGSPWNAIRSPAAAIHRANGSSSGNSSSTARSVAAMSAGSPDSATQRNGPRPSQNNGRTYAGTNPG